ncbi:MAG: formylglycine-generating enzyme family protein [Chloroflexi bacterium]|nr:formylglycine-generating enzyme family protein [Chloroflexota bacterium]
MQGPRRPRIVRQPASAPGRLLVGALAGCLMLLLCGAATGGALRPTASGAPLAPPGLGDLALRAQDKMAMLYVPAGRFRMGSDLEMAAYARRLCLAHSGEARVAIAVCPPSAFQNERPVHEVTLTAFWLDRTEVTNGQYRQCVLAGACAPPVQTDSFTRSVYYGDPAYDDYPVIWVDWNAACAYCAWAGARLPSEAEWEYAARGPDSSLFPWGNLFDPTRLNYCGADCDGVSDPSYADGYPDTAPVGCFPAGASWMGALDLAGNVREWVADWYGLYHSESQHDPTGPLTGSGRITRGGSWYDKPDDVRSANRGENAPDYVRHKVGFRCALDAH